MKEKSFNWVVMLIVLAILAVLAAVALPSYQDYNARPQVTSATVNGSPVDAALQQLLPGAVAFNTPRQTMMGEANTISLVLASNAEPKDVELMMESIDAIESARIRVSDRMEATLNGSGFEIVPLTHDIQAVATSEPTTWKWEVRARAPGRQTLHLTISALITVNGTETPRAFRTFEAVIPVKVTMGQRVSAFVGTNWQWLWTTLLIPLIGWWLRRRKSEGGKE